MSSTSPWPSDAVVAGAESSPGPADRRTHWRDLALLSCVGAAMFAIRLTGAPNFFDNEFRVGACVLDVLQHGNWLCPHDVLSLPAHVLPDRVDASDTRPLGALQGASHGASWRPVGCAAHAS